MSQQLKVVTVGPCWSKTFPSKLEEKLQELITDGWTVEVQTSHSSWSDGFYFGAVLICRRDTPPCESTQTMETVEFTEPQKLIRDEFLKVPEVDRLYASGDGSQVHIYIEDFSLDIQGRIHDAEERVTSILLRIPRFYVIAHQGRPVRNALGLPLIFSKP